jgi:carbon storage regulator
MLVLTRKTFERLLIGDNVVIEIISAKSGKVKLGIDAPEDVRVAREEIDDPEGARERIAKKRGKPRASTKSPVKRKR